MQGSQGVSFLKWSKIWSLPAIQSQSAWSKVTFQARNRSAPLSSLVLAPLHPSIHPSLPPSALPRSLSLCRDGSSQHRRHSPTYHITILPPRKPLAPRSRQGHARRERQGQPPTLLLHNVAINRLENCLSRQKPVLGATGAADIYFARHLRDKHLLPSGALDAPVTHNN